LLDPLAAGPADDLASNLKVGIGDRLIAVGATRTAAARSGRGIFGLIKLELIVAL